MLHNIDGGRGMKGHLAIGLRKYGYGLVHAEAYGKGMIGEVHSNSTAIALAPLRAC